MMIIIFKNLASTLIEEMKNFIFLLSIFLLSGCASISTTYNYEPEGEFDRYQTFYCLECTDDLNKNAPQYDNQENRELIRRAIEQELIGRGYILEKEDPDLLVDFHIVIEQKSDVVGEAYPMAWQTHDFAYYPIYYDYGTLVVHLVDRNKDQLVWQGTASKILENPKNAQKTIGRALEKLFGQYQFQAGN